MIERRYSDGQHVFRAGEAADGVYRLRTGCVRLDRPAGHGVPGRHTLRPGEFFGELGFLVGDDRDADAVAVGEVAVDFLRRNEFLALLTARPELAMPLFGPIFAAADAAAPGVPKPQPAPAVSPGRRIRLIPDGRRVRTLVARDQIVVDRLPFLVGRTANGEGGTTYADISLALDDRRPYNLSRRHFAIEDESGALLVRDFGSYHGTTLNGIVLGGDGNPRSAPLPGGESDLVAGRSDSPFRFRIVVD